MITLKKIFSVLLISILLVAVTGVSFSKHICFSGKAFKCVKNEDCCKSEHSGINKPTCCEVQDFYFKADIVSIHDNYGHKFFTDNFIVTLQNHFFISPSQVQPGKDDLNYKPPLLQSSRSILLDSSRLTV